MSYTQEPEIENSRKFLAASVPLQCDEPTDFMSFRVGLFGLDKWHNVDRTAWKLAAALDLIL